MVNTPRGRILPLLLAQLIILPACGSRTAGRIPDSTDLPPEIDARVVSTNADPRVVRAGTPLRVECVIQEDGAPLQEDALVVVDDASPTAAPGGVVDVTLQQAGSATITCQTGDGVVADPVGVTVEIEPAEVAVIETAVNVPATPAGAPVAVTCDSFDAFGNMVSQPAGVTLDLPPELELDPPTGAGFVIRGTASGNFDVACRLGDVVDITPEILTVLAGLPGDSDTVVSATSVFPSDTVDVSCDVTDEFGNPVDVETRLLILSDNGSTSEEAGISQDATSFSATEAGVYYVACAVDGFLAADDTPAEVTVWPGPPAAWDVSLPNQDCFWQDRGLPLQFVIYDAWGNVLDLPTLQSEGPPEFDTISLNVNSTPAGAALDASNVLYVPGEGVFDLSAELITDPSFRDPMSTVMPFVASVTVDSTPPSFTSFSPARSSMLEQGGVANDSVGISGSVQDTVSPITEITILGAQQPVGGSSLAESFSTSQVSRWGLNIITGSVSDECGNTRLVAQSYLRSGAYFGATESAGQGIHAHLNQDMIDDGDRLDLDDIASIGEAIIAGVDFNSLLAPGQVLVSDGDFGCFEALSYAVRRDDNASREIIIAPPRIVELTAVDGGIDFVIEVPDPGPGAGISIPLEARGRTICLPTIGWLGFEAGAQSVEASGTLLLSTVNGNVVASVSNLNLNTTGLFADPDCGLFDFLCDPIFNIAVPALEGPIEGALEDVVRDQVGPLVEDFLEGFGLSTSFNVPPPLDLELNIASSIDFAQFTGPTFLNSNNGYGKLGLATQIFPTVVDDELLGARGPIRKDGIVPIFARSPYAFGIGLKEDLLNQILHAVWYGGGLNLPDLTTLVGGLGIDGVTLGFNASLPPVSMPGSGSNQFDIGIGDAFIGATVDLGEALGGESTGVINLGMYLSAVVGGSLGVDTSGAEPSLTVDLDSNPVVYVEIVTIDDEGYQAPMTQLFTNILQLLLPELLGQVLGSFPIPAFDVGGLAGLPPGTQLQINPTDLDRPAGSDYFRMTGGVELQ